VEANLINHEAMCLGRETIVLSCPMTIHGLRTCYRDSDGQEYASSVLDAALWEQGWEMCVLPDFANELRFCE